MPPPTPRRRTRSPSPPRPSPLAPDPGPDAMALYDQGRAPPRGEPARDGRPQGDRPGARRSSRRARGPWRKVMGERATSFSSYTYESRRRGRSRDRRPLDDAAHGASEPPLMSGANGGAPPRAPGGATPPWHAPGDEPTLWPEKSHAQTEPEFHDRLRRRNWARGLKPDDDGWREQAQRCRPQDGRPARRDDLIYVVKTLMVKEK